MLLPLVALVLAQGSLVAPGAQLTLIRGGFSFTEGTTDDANGNVFFTDQPSNCIWEYSTDGKFTEFLHPCGRANGMWIDKRGRLITCSDEHNQLWLVSQGQATVLVHDYNGKLLNGPNDVWVRPDGGMYITDPMYARPYWARDPKPQIPGNYVFYLSPDGQLIPAAIDLNVPNGIIGSPDGKWLYVGDLGANATYRYRIEPSGSLSDKTLFCHLGSDGMTMDARGDVYLTGKGVTVFDPSGQEILHVPVPEPWVGHVCFGGARHDTLFIAASQGLYSMKMAVRGAF
jgi:gluconolactonase